MKNLICLCCVTVGLSTLAGCGGLAEGNVEAIGIVTLDGAPVAGASVVFAPVDPTVGKAAFSITDKNGKFELGTADERDGAKPGSYKIQVSKTVETQGGGGAPVDLGEDAEHAVGDAANVSWKNALPKKYANPNTSGTPSTSRKRAVRS